MISNHPQARSRWLLSSFFVFSLIAAQGCAGCDEPVDEDPEQNNSASAPDMEQDPEVDPGAEDMPAEPGEPDMPGAQNNTTPTPPDMRDPVEPGEDMDTPTPDPDMGTIIDVDLGPLDTRIDAVVPPRGPVTGGTPFVIDGAGFTTDSVVFFGTERVDVELIDGNLVGEAPAGTGPGPVSVKVLDPDNGDDALDGGFTYTPRLELHAVSPTLVPTDGGVEIELRGAGFDQDTRVSFDGATALRHELVDARLLRVIAPVGEPGPADVRVTNLDASLVSYGAVTYFARMGVTAVRPASGDVAGGEEVEVLGAGFEDGMTVEFGGRRAAVVSVAPDGSSARVTTPGALSAGLVDVSVATDDDAAIAADVFYYSAGAEFTIATVSPESGPLSGGNEVVLLGSGLGDAGLQVSIGGVDAPVVEQGAGHAVVTAPAGAMLGAVDVAISSGASSDVLAGAYSYVEDLFLDRVTPSSGDVAGGYDVVLDGQGFSGASKVLFGGVRAAGFTVDSDSKITATAPARSAGVVDVSVARGDVTSTFKDAFTFTEDLDVFGFAPVSGSVAGNTYVVIRGRGFVGDVKVAFGGVESPAVEVLDSQTLAARTPPSTITGLVDVEVTNGVDDTVTAADRFNYFNPGARFGGTWGGSIQGAVNVTVYSRELGALPSAFVMLSTRADTSYQGLTNTDGMVTLSGPDVYGEQTITAVAAGHSSATVQRADAENVTIFLSMLPPSSPPDMGDGMLPMPPPDPIPAEFSGQLTGLDKLAEPGPNEFQMAVVYTTQINPYTPNPLPGDQNVLLSNGQYRLTSRLGDLALVAVGGLYNNSTQTFKPLRMAVSRYHFASEGMSYTVDLDLNIPLNEELPIKLNNAPADPVEGPNGNRAKVWLDFGFEGVFGNLPVVTGTSNLLDFKYLPELDGQLLDVTLFVEAGAYTNGGAAPYSIGLARGVTALNQTLELDLLDIGRVYSPADGGSPINGTVSFSYDSPFKPDLFYIRIDSFDGITLWEAFIPGTATSVRLPDFPSFAELPPDLRPVPYSNTPAVMLLIGIKQPGLDLNNFSYADLGLDKWTAYSLGITTILL